ncbi:uncharacterized protein METZ01_LOCUS339757 [marine metagenome]|uniref:Xylose isomerase-like TIM barrel domain-containing protein n=1 Tax=marine metagenome TaxID=408172 RepID=A0A382QN16_9ZZZZ
MPVKYNLSAPTEVGIHDLSRLNLTAEMHATTDPAKSSILSGKLISAHAPYVKNGLRLNYAAKDIEHRTYAISYLKTYISKLPAHPTIKQINLHPPQKQWFDETQISGKYGDYELMIKAIQEIAIFANKFELEIVIENMNASFTRAETLDENSIDWNQMNISFGDSPEEWIKICEDVNLDNVFLCLDSSHTCTYAHKFKDDNTRTKRVMDFLKRPELIRHVHWSDNYLYDNRGRKDSHLSVGKGTLPTKLHQQIKKLDATILLEHFHGISELEEELEYINQL